MFLCLFFHHIIYFILYFSVLSLSLFLSAKKHILILSGIRDTPTNNKESKEGEKLVTPYFTIYMQILSNHYKLPPNPKISLVNYHHKIAPLKVMNQSKSHDLSF